MPKLIARMTVALLAAIVPVLVTAQTTAPGSPVTAVGCIIRNGTVDPDKGIRRLNMDPDGLALVNAQLRGTQQRTGAVPGSAPAGTNSGTIPRGTLVGRAGEANDQNFALTGSTADKLAEHIGRRVEIVGRVTEAKEANGDAAARGTTGSSADAPAVTGAGRREQLPAEGPAHPSTEIPRLEVTSFQVVSGICD